MILFISFSGGMGISYKGSVDLSTLPENLKQTARTELSEPRLSQYGQKERNQFTTDSVSYEMRFENSDEVYRIDESRASESLLELIDALRPYMELEPK